MASEDDRLTLAAWHLFALAKLRMYREAESAFNGLGDLDAPHYVKQSPEGAFQSPHALSQDMHAPDGLLTVWQLGRTCCCLLGVTYCHR